LSTLDVPSQAIAFIKQEMLVRVLASVPELPMGSPACNNADINVEADTTTGTWARRSSKNSSGLPGIAHRFSDRSRSAMSNSRKPSELAARHHRYQLTPLGRRVAVLFTKVYGRVLAPGLATLDPRLPMDLAERSQLALAWRQLDHRLNQFTDEGLTAA
jgi:hypothetical protein